MAKNKKSFVLYVDQRHVFDALDDDEAGRLIKHLFAYVSDENPEPKDKIIKIAFEPIMRQLKRDLAEWEATKDVKSKAGYLGGIKSGEVRRSKTKQSEANEADASKTKQSEANEAVTVIDTVIASVIPSSFREEGIQKSIFKGTRSLPYEELLPMIEKLKGEYKLTEQICREGGWGEGNTAEECYEELPIVFGRRMKERFYEKGYKVMITDYAHCKNVYKAMLTKMKDDKTYTSTDV